MFVKDKEVNTKKYINNDFVFLIMVVLFSISLSACGKHNGNYEYGTYEQSIESKFNIVSGSSTEAALRGSGNTVVITYAKVADGGMVAWKNGEYCYTTEDVTGANICTQFALHYDYLEPIKFN